MKISSSTPTRREPTAPDAGALGAPAGRAHAPARRSTRSSARSTCSPRARRCASRSSRAGRTRWSSTGRPGSGKTTLARIVARPRRTPRSRSSAPSRPGAPRCARCSSAPEHRRRPAEPTVFFLDEIHRFNKAQQDALLPAVEEGLVTLIGATTENPYFEVNSALLSRCQVYELRPLLAGDVEVARCAARVERGDRRARPTRTRSPSWPRAPAATRARRWPRSSSPSHTATAA